MTTADRGVSFFRPDDSSPILLAIHTLLDLGSDEACTAGDPTCFLDIQKCNLEKIQRVWSKLSSDLSFLWLDETTSRRDDSFATAKKCARINVVVCVFLRLERPQRECSIDKGRTWSRRKPTMSHERWQDLSMDASTTSHFGQNARWCSRQTRKHKKVQRYSSYPQKNSQTSLLDCSNMSCRQEWFAKPVNDFFVWLGKEGPHVVAERARRVVG